MIELGPALHAQFETTLDEAVEMHVWWIQANPVTRRQRVRTLWAAGVSFAVVSLAIFAIEIHDLGLLVLTAMVVPVGLGAGAFAWVYGRFYNRAIRRNIRRYLRDQVGERTAWTAEFELRTNGVWSRGLGVEVLLPWEDAVEVEDRPKGVVLRFRSGLCCVRNRAFETTDDRRVFLERARQLARAREPRAESREPREPQALSLEP